jgi:hypothetical protein
MVADEGKMSSARRIPMRIRRVKNLTVLSLTRDCTFLRGISPLEILSNLNLAGCSLPLGKYAIENPECAVLGDKSFTTTPASTTFL